LIDYRTMLKGKPQKLVSKFKISYNLLLNLIEIGESSLVEFTKRSMIQDTITSQLGSIYGNITKLESDLQKDITLRTPEHIVNEYIKLQEQVRFLSNKKKKRC